MIGLIHPYLGKKSFTWICQFLNAFLWFIGGEFQQKMHQDMLARSNLWRVNTSSVMAKSSQSHIIKIINASLCHKGTMNQIREQWVNSLAPGRSECDSKNIIFNLVLLIGIFRSSHDNAVWWMPQDLSDDKSTLVQVMAWCHQATSHYLGQCWLISLPPYAIARPQWVEIQTESSMILIANFHNSVKGLK